MYVCMWTMLHVPHVHVRPVVRCVYLLLIFLEGVVTDVLWLGLFVVSSDD